MFFNPINLTNVTLIPNATVMLLKMRNHLCPSLSPGFKWYVKVHWAFSDKRHYKIESVFIIISIKWDLSLSYFLKTHNSLWVTHEIVLENILKSHNRVDRKFYAVWGFLNLVTIRNVKIYLSGRMLTRANDNI